MGLVEKNTVDVELTDVTHREHKNVTLPVAASVPAPMKWPRGESRVLDGDIGYLRSIRTSALYRGRNTISAVATMRWRKPFVESAIPDSPVCYSCSHIESRMTCRRTAPRSALRGSRITDAVLRRAFRLARSG
jgi:hypothetical protein